MKKIDILKMATEIVVSVGVGVITGNVIGASTPAALGTVKQFCVDVGSFVLSSMIREKAANYATEKIDEVVNTVKDMINEDETK